jgi:hypothetical protein
MTTGPTLIERDDAGHGQTPLLKHRIMQWLQEHAEADGDLPRTADSVTIANETRSTVANVNRVLWALQKQGLLTLRERKNGNAGGQSHSSAPILTHFTLTPKGQTWRLDDPTVLADLGETMLSAEVLKDRDSLFDPTWAQDVDNAELASDIRREAGIGRVAKAADLIREHKPAPCTCEHPAGTVLRNVEHERGCPWAAQQEAMAKAVRAADVSPVVKGEQTPEDFAKHIIEQGEQARPPFRLDKSMEPGDALFAYLKHMGGRAKIVPEANVALGYDPKSTALYSIVRGNPEGYAIEKGWIMLKDDRPAGWKPKTQKSHNRFRPERVVSTPTSDDDPRPHVAIGTVTSQDAGFRALVAIDLAEGYPAIKQLMEREGKRAKVSEAVAALEAAGLEDDALTVLGRIPDDTPLEREVIALVKELRNG